MFSSNLSSKAESQAKNNVGEQQNAETSTFRRVHNLIILDESGSMQSIYQPALTGVNETLQTIRAAQTENKNQEHFVTLVTFDSCDKLRYNEIYHQTPANKAVDINDEQYRPYGSTPLYDAMGRAINELRDSVKENDVVLVTIITDGYENDSREYSGKAIKALVEEMRAKGWVFTYIGANQDVEKVAASMSINNHLEFKSDEEGTSMMFDKELRSRKNFFRKLNCVFSNEELQDDYFSEL